MSVVDDRGDERNDGEWRTPGGIRIDPVALSWQFSRSSGPGGQHVNTTESRVELRCDLDRAGLGPGLLERLVERLGGTDVRVVVAEHRSQRRNRDLAWERLAERLDVANRPVKRRRPTRPSKGSVQRRLDAKKRTSTRKAERRQPNRRDD